MTWTPEDRAPRAYRDTATAARKGLIMIYTGEGKGKTTAALGLAFRALGYRWRVAMVQFIKGKWKTGEDKMCEQLKGRIDGFRMGEGFTWITKNYERDVATARKAWEKCLEVLKDERYRVVIFDELNYVLKYNFLPVEEIVEALKQKPAQTHVIITGRDAPAELIELADLVTEMREIKHPFRAGLKAQPGIDY
ncbi:MAG: cob(I)yrinic acid a,c-diamide adenosyltransferase [Candidatus Omnitrophica bacterium]|nr:cob(I)yrinic acid a,c-diamide adenosyltransferase [Candidatus Omnitrophota bacterium]